MRTAREEWKAALSDDERAQVSVLWGKSGLDPRSGNRTDPTLLVQHLLDTLAVGELLWDEYLAPAVRDEIDRITLGSGRRFFAWLCGIHDLGKASPAFQSQDRGLASAVRQASLPVSAARGLAPKWRHERASGLILLEGLQASWASSAAVDWVWPLAAGHHGQFPSRGAILRLTRRDHGVKRRRLHGSPDDWGGIQSALLRAVTLAAGYQSLEAVEPTARPTRAVQLALSGFIVMADWIASNHKVLQAVPDWSAVSISLGRQRAQRAVDAVGFGRGLGRRAVPTLGEAARRLDIEPRPLQQAMFGAANDLDGAGLIICEAPTGEGKTEAALMASEVLAGRFGADGVFVALPTQATANAMLRRIVPWLDRLGDGLEFALVHGGKATSEAWQQYIRQRDDNGDVVLATSVDEYGCPDELGLAPTSGFAGIGTDCPGDDCLTASAASEWFDGRKRGLLARNGVGTIDQLLFAGTRTKHVMLRYAGLAGKVVIIDEVHAVDSYMATFLDEVLAWLGLGRIPVVLLSATLAPDQRRTLIESYLGGALNQTGHSAEWATEPHRHPQITSAWVEDDTPRHRVATASTWRSSHRVHIDRIDERDATAELNALTALLTDSLAEGGSALVIRNTVDRACDTYDALVHRFGHDEVYLLHGRLCSGPRAAITDEVVDLLGRGERRPHRSVVVATQVAEQSFDVDADLLVTDHAPIDLLIQRAGRMHRHARPASARPPRVSEPRIVLTGLDLTGDTPWFAGGSVAVYGLHLLLRSAAALMDGVPAGSITLPDDAPGLVTAVYGDEDLVPASWAQLAHEAEREWRDQLTQSVSAAKQYVLVGQGNEAHETLDGLHDYSGGAEDQVRVRDGDMGTEIVLVTRDDSGYRSIEGDRLGVNAERAAMTEDERTARRLTRAVLAGTVRLPGAASGFGKRLEAAATSLGTLPEWSDHPTLRHLKVLTLDADLRGAVGEIPVRYDRVRGLLVGAAP